MSAVVISNSLIEKNSFNNCDAFLSKKTHLMNFHLIIMALFLSLKIGFETKREAGFGRQSGAGIFRIDSIPVGSPNNPNLRKVEVKLKVREL